MPSNHCLLRCRLLHARIIYFCVTSNNKECGPHIGCPFELCFDLMKKRKFRDLWGNYSVSEICTYKLNLVWFVFRLKKMFATVSCLRNDPFLKSVQKWPENIHFALFTKIQSKSLNHTVFMYILAVKAALFIWSLFICAMAFFLNPIF